MSVLVCHPAYLGTLDQQGLAGVELITWQDMEWHQEAGRIAAGHGWSHLRSDSASGAVAKARADFLIEWNVYEASSDALASLLRACLEQPDKRGSMSANWDPAVLWRRDEFVAGQGRSGLAQATGVAIDAGGSSTVLIPSTRE